LPLISLVTGPSRYQPFGRIARWLGSGFDRLGVSYDAVYLEGPPGVKECGSVREVRLGEVRARVSILRLARYLREARPALLLTMPAHVSPFATAAATLARIPVVPWEHAFLMREMPLHARHMRLLPLVQRLTYLRAAAVAGVSGDVILEARELLSGCVDSRRFFLLPNPIDADEVRQQAGSAASNDEVFQICAMGTLSHHRGVDVLVEALAIIRSRVTRPWRAVILGEGVERDSLEALARHRGVGDRIFFHGHVENPYPTVARSHVFAHAARFEGFGLVLTEALSLGVPVVATECPGGPREILTPDCGILVPPDDPHSMADALERLVNDDELHQTLSLGGMQRVLDYAPERVAQLVLDMGRSIGALRDDSGS
jgi:glycosyltransferase involved in cell wall biosynthesis